MFSTPLFPIQIYCERDVIHSRLVWNSLSVRINYPVQELDLGRPSKMFSMPFFPIQIYIANMTLFTRVWYGTLFSDTLFNDII
jgi:hypothetical protein